MYIPTYRTHIIVTGEEYVSLNKFVKIMKNVASLFSFNFGVKYANFVKEPGVLHSFVV